SPDDTQTGPVCIQRRGRRPLSSETPARRLPLLHFSPRALACAALFSLSACATTPLPADAQLYTNFTLLDPATETRIDDAYMVVARGRILATGRGDGPANIPSNRRRDMNGAYALPGLI